MAWKLASHFASLASRACAVSFAQGPLRIEFGGVMGDFTFVFGMRLRQLCGMLSSKL